MTSSTSVTPEPSLEDLAIQAADYLDTLDHEQANYIAYALRVRIANSRASATTPQPADRAQPDGALLAAREIVKTYHIVTDLSRETGPMELGDDDYEAEQLATIIQRYCQPTKVHEHDWRWFGWPLSNPACEEHWCDICGLRQVVVAGKWADAAPEGGK